MPPGMWAGPLGRGRREARPAYPRAAAHKQVQHILAHLVVVFVQELVHLKKGIDGSVSGLTHPSCMQPGCIKGLFPVLCIPSSSTRLPSFLGGNEPHFCHLICSILLSLSGGGVNPDWAIPPSTHSADEDNKVHMETEE